jgi:starch-binding outer membrane protein, SusD/RagB family
MSSSFLTRRRLRGVRAAAVAVAAAAVLGACGDAADTLLEAVDPDLINPEDTRSAEGAQALYVGTFGRLRSALTGTGDSSGDFLFGGLLADEWSTSSTFIQNDEFDQRKIVENNSTATGLFRGLARVRTSANQAIAGLREFRPTETYKVAEMYLQRGLAELQMALDFCNGTPISDAAGDAFVLGNPESNEQVFQRAVASFDSALAVAGAATDANNTLIRRAALVGKARTLLALGLNRAAEAAALVSATAVPTTFTYDQTFSLNAGTNNLWGQPLSSRRFTVSDTLEGNARNLLVKNTIPFFSARDPRLPVTYTVSANGRDTTKSQDGFTFSRTTSLYSRETPVAIASGLDARLVEAEARLIANDFAGMTSILNALRATPPKLGEVQPTAAQLPPLSAPTTRDAAINLFFREKAFWTFSRGQRLGDMRRLVRLYGRPVEAVFPVGTHYRGGEYGTDVNIPITTEELTNPNASPNRCTDRKA